MAMSRRWSLRALATLAASVLLYSGACSDADVAFTDPADEVDPALADVVFEGSATPDALEQLLADAPVFDQTWYPKFRTPADGESISPDEPYRFSWEVLSAAGAPAPEGALPSRWLRELVGPMRAAHAQELPFDGVAYLLVISDPADRAVLRVFTTETSYTPDAAAWDLLQGQGTDLIGWLLMGRFVDGKLVSTRSQSSWLVFRIET